MKDGNAKARYLELTTTLPSQDLAGTIASALIERHLAACVQISGPITSVYRWEGAIETSSEYRLTIKTTAAAFKRLRAAILEQHPYDVPEILAVPIADGHVDYLTWLDEQVEP